MLVITKDNDFDRTRQAISFGVDEYLLKPVKKVQIAKALQMIEDKLAGELVIETALSVENIFMACLNGQIHKMRLLTELHTKSMDLRLPIAETCLWYGLETAIWSRGR